MAVCDICGNTLILLPPNQREQILYKRVRSVVIKAKVSVMVLGKREEVGMATVPATVCEPCFDMLLDEGQDCNQFGDVL